MVARAKKKISWQLRNPALLILDVQKDFLEEYPAHKKIIPKIKAISEECRKVGIPVIHTLYVCSKDKEGWPSLDALMERGKCIEGTYGAREVDELHNEKDIYIKKRRFSAFFGTELDRILAQHKVETLILTGLLTHCCVYATAMDAYQRDYKVIFVKDAVSSYRTKLHSELINGFFTNSVGEVTTAKEIIRKLKGPEVLHGIEGIEWGI